jgi:aarF domain-containing kinase
MSSLRTGLLARSSLLLSTAARVAGTEVKHQLGRRLARSPEGSALRELAARVEQAEILAGSLVQLKGAVMKAGQWLSIDAADFLPPEAAAILAKVQAQAEPVPFEVVEGVLAGALDPARLARLSLERTPAAAASIGQVHRGEWEGRAVAVKVQYPGIASAIDSDLELLARLANGWLGVARRDVDLAPMFEELRTLLHQEADYGAELASLLEYRSILAAEAGFVVPEPVPELSAREVLTMSWEEGLPIGAWAEGGPSRAEREWLAGTLLDLFCLEFFGAGFVQTDPNPANFLVRPAERRVVLLDLGAALRYDLDFRRRYVGLLETMALGSDQELIDAGIAFELLDPREGPEARALFVAMLRGAVEPFAPELQPFAFRDPDHLARSRDITLRFARSLRHSPPPRALVFLHRKLGGLFNLLKRLDVRLDLRPYWAKMVKAPAPSLADRVALGA